jgi:hypothetical protein
MRRSLVYECDEKKAAEQYQHPSAPAKSYPIVSRHWNLAGLIDPRTLAQRVRTAELSGAPELLAREPQRPSMTQPWPLMRSASSS